MALIMSGCLSQAVRPSGGRMNHVAVNSSHVVKPTEYKPDVKKF